MSSPSLDRLTASQELGRIEEALRSLNFVLELLETKRDSLRKRRDLLLTSAKRMEGRGGA
jgi:hypothetical protein